ncbi:hypothetical protein VZT92_006833 [Zoarces viviparus]|uniref:Uncharacterized protein n=1 Tax=Zoarces viviparus TaxID=48416 RepID=A0AAW1E7T5_ZOAVI
MACQSRTDSELSTLPDTGRGNLRGGSRQRRGRTLPVLARRVSNAAFSDRTPALQTGPAPVAWSRLFAAGSASSAQRVGQGQPFPFNDEQPGPSSGGLPPPPTPPPPPPDGEQPGPSSIGLPPPPPATLPGIFPAPVPASHPPLPGPHMSRSTTYRKRKAAEAAAAGQGSLPRSKPRQPTTQYVCTKCSQPKTLATGHTRLFGEAYCASVGGKTVEEWREEMNKKHKGGP